ncbi:NADH dehydrogenase subunit 2 (mitochondrion) [Betta splendens]|uniref:NADH-ubiquinone oxidoreductase chain 2 n=2 Tax=Betta TaxID=158455 RepID=A0A0C6ERJ2_BETSP|nr:NADH dehydrogenase subunit 2 [Betta splendens]YP_009947882.1 NADH dehydrogenase subunit 2 [Betta mahachaiensis]QOH97050.1 NADH dehydrogenase subunit 2 [Betta mahachaiensis]BAQ35529.1 NADH dehydrogenase subunit 2 [Betta splendens]
MSPYTLTIMIFGIGLGTTITLMSSHWLLAWMGLEINTLAMLPLMSQHNHPRAVQATTKYFLTQATAAAMLLFASTTNAWITGEWAIQQMTSLIPLTMITMPLTLKIGLAPMHSWLPEVLQGLDLNTGLIMSTWQKLAPFALLLQIQANNPTLLITLGLLSTLVGGWGGMNQTQLRKILAYSSIAHLGWMMLILPFSPSLTLITFITYIIMTCSTFMIFEINKATNINMLATSWAKAPTLTSLTPLVLLSLGGLPPLTGFMPKWLILQELTKQELTTTATFVAMTALLSLYFYLRLSYAMTLTMAPNNLPGTIPWRLQFKSFSMPLATTTMASITLLPIMPAMSTLLKL